MSVKAVFIGMPGSGKTTVGRLVAAALACQVADSDDLVVQREGRTVPEIFASEGEEGFRAVEAACIAEALHGFDGVLSLGGGAVLAESTRAALAGHPVVFIHVAHGELVRRISGSPTPRPLLEGDPEGRLAALWRERHDIYRRCARYTVEGPAWRVARRVLDLLGRPDARVRGEPAP